MIKAVGFDIDGTLYPKKILNRNLAVTFLIHPKKSFYYNKLRKIVRLIDDETFYEYGKNFKTREASVINRDPDYFDCIYKTMSNRLFKLKPFDGVYSSILKLKQLGFKIFALSDFPVETKLEEMKIEKLFDFAISCFETGYLKPSKRVFDMPLSILKCRPEEVIYIGDRLDTDMLSALNAGIKPIYFNPKQTQALKINFADTQIDTFHSYNQLCKIIIEEAS